MGYIMDEKQRIAELVVMLQNGDGSAFDELYKLTNSRAFFVALEITKNDQDAEDILQESYVKMLEKIGSLDKPESFVSWFHHIVANKSKDSLKKKKPTLFEGGEDEAFEVIPDEDTSFSPEENLNQEELRKTVLEAIEELSDEKRACVMLMYFEEMSVNEISETLDIPVSTVKNRLFTARKDLKTKFEKRGITSLYSTAPIGVVIWALMRTSEAVSETFGSTEASARILSGIKASGAVSAASSATAATAATGAASSAAGSAAAAAGGTVAKAAALTVLQKVTIGVVATAVVGGSTVGVATVVKNKREEEASSVYTEEVTTLPDSYNEAFAQITVSTTDASVLTVSFESSDETETVTVEFSTAKQTNASSTQKKNSSTTRVSSSAAKTTEKQKTTSKSTKATKATKPSTTRRDYFPNKTSAPQESETVKTTAESTTKRKRVTTTEEETTTKAPETTKEKTTKAPETDPPTEAETVPPTEAETTTQAPKDATVSVEVYDGDNNFINSFSISVPAGTTMDWDYLAGEASKKGYDAAGFDGDAFDAVAEEGKSYSLTVYSM